MPPPLTHLRVVDLTDLRGAFAGRLLADLGADVVKVEPPRGDAGRFVPPFAGGVAAPDRSLPFLYRKANKRGAVLDLHQAGGWHRFGTLCEQADILIENRGPEGERRHGLTPAEVQERHPHLVHVALADLGLTGPRAGWRLEALPAFAASGALHASGFRERPPCWLPGYAAHDCGAVFAVAGALAALLARARHGAGQTVEVSVQEAALNGMNPWSIPLADYARLYPMLPVSPPRNADGAYHVLETADGYVRVLPGSPRQWRAFVALLGNPEALEGEHWGVALFRLMNGDVVRVVAAEALAGRTRAEVLAEGRRRGVPPPPRHGRARRLRPLVDLQRRLARPAERRPRPAHAARPRAGAPSLRGGGRPDREQPRRRGPPVGPRLRGRPPRPSRHHLRRLPGLRPRRAARRGLRLRPAQLGLRGRHLALEPSRRAVSRRVLAQPPRPHRRQAGGGRGAGRARAPPPHGRGAADRDVAGGGGGVSDRRVLPGGAGDRPARRPAGQRGSVRLPARRLPERRRGPLGGHRGGRR